MTVTWHYQSCPERLGIHVSTQRHHQQQSDAQIHLSTWKVTQSWCFCLYNKKWKRSSRFHHPSPTVKAFVTSQVTHLFAGNARSMCQLATSQERHPFWPGKHHSRICPSSTSTIGDVAELETSWMTFRNGPSTLYNNIYVSIYILRMIYTCKLFKTMMQHTQKHWFWFWYIPWSTSLSHVHGWHYDHPWLVFLLHGVRGLQDPEPKCLPRGQVSSRAIFWMKCPWFHSAFFYTDGSQPHQDSAIVQKTAPPP